MDSDPQEDSIGIAATRRMFNTSEEQFGELLGVSGDTVRQWERSTENTTNPDVAWRLRQLKEVGELLHLVYEPDGVQAFLDTPMRVFDGDTALTLLIRGEYGTVISALAADYEGGMGG